MTCSTQSNIKKLKRVQSYAARIVTGLLVIGLINYLYLKTEWEP